MTHPDFLKPTDTFVHRHLGPTEADIQEMLATLGLQSLDALIDQTVPDDIRLRRPLALPGQRSEQDVLNELRAIAAQNRIFRSLIGMGYYDCITPRSFNGTFWKIRGGTPNTRRIRRRSRKADWR